jgi:ribulose-5-phosphate 4-epimerase/fuculose-1-phosphate aldolase
MQEGYLKFTIHLTEGDVPVSAELERLNECRTELHDLKMVGIYPNGIGYGNVSIRVGQSEKFIISGTSTGARRILPLAEYCLIDAFDLAKNEVFCTGRVRASAETMSHGVIYRTHPQVMCVLHAHDRKLFDFMLANGYPRTPESAEFGTPEIATEIASLVRAAPQPQGLFATAGHDEGIIAYGPDIAAAMRLLVEANNRMKRVCGSEGLRV